MADENGDFSSLIMERISGLTAEDFINVALFNQQAFDSQGLLRLHPAEFYLSLPPKLLRYWCYLTGMYAVPTAELMAWLLPEIGPAMLPRTIEIAAGRDRIGAFLGVPMTDSWACCDLINQMFYNTLQQPMVVPCRDVEVLTAEEAVNKYRPEVVVAGWVTHKNDDPTSAPGNGRYDGVDEEWLLTRVKKYIVVGNLDAHHIKPILKRKHREVRAPWLVSKAVRQEHNRIFIWEGTG